MPIARKNIFVSLTSILADDWTAELEQLYKFFSGLIADTVSHKLNSPNTNCIVENSNGTVIEFKQNNVTKLMIVSNQQFQSLVQTGIAPIDVVSITKVIGLNASYLNGKSLAQYYLNNIHLNI